jgi:hypothetical protein
MDDRFVLARSDNVSISARISAANEKSIAGKH